MITTCEKLTNSRQKPVRERCFPDGATLPTQAVLELKPWQVFKRLDTPGGRQTSLPTLPPWEIAPFTVVFLWVSPDLSGGSTLNVVSAPISSAPTPIKP